MIGGCEIEIDAGLLVELTAEGNLGVDLQLE